IWYCDGNFNLSPVFIHVDFEKAVITAAINVFDPELVIIRGYDDDKFSKFCSMIDGHSFLSLEQVNEGMDLLKQTKNEYSNY
ncbi:MULE domain-containing protein, partial [Aphis craccivora]